MIKSDRDAQLGTPSSEQQLDTGPRVSARSLTREYVSKSGVVRALDDVSVDLMPGEMVVLLGPSGCGKTTLLRSIAGLDRPQAGEIRIGDKTVFSSTQRAWVPPEKRGLSMVFQSYALWPHMTVFENIAYPLRARHVSRSTVNERVAKVAEVVDLSHVMTRLPSQLSGGQQQRVALARAIVADVDIVLFDEPLSNVDAQVRDQVRREVVLLQRELGFSGLYVTHDQIEAGALADRVVVMNKGTVAQVGRPQEIYDAPNSLYVANFMGTTNEIQATRLTDRIGGRAQLETELGTIVGEVRNDSLPASGAVVALFRPEAAMLCENDAPGPNVWDGLVERCMFMGSYNEILIRLSNTSTDFTIHTPRGQRPEEGEHIWFRVPEELVSVLAL